MTSHGIELNVDSYEVCKNGIPVKLTQLEFELLLTFLKHKNQVLTRIILFHRCGGMILQVMKNSKHSYYEFTT